MKKYILIQYDPDTVRRELALARTDRHARWVIEVPDNLWQATGSDEDPRSRLLAAGLVINGVAMHLEAYALADKDEQSFSDDRYFEEEEHGFFALTQQAVCVTEIRGRRYVLVATPHGD